MRLADQQAELLSQMEELRQAELARSEFSANVTHELKTPIASILGASELLRDGFVLEEDIPDFAGRIHDEGERLSALVNDVLALSRLDESERVGSRELIGVGQKMDLLEIANDVVRRMAGRADLADVSLELVGESVIVKGLPHLLDELVANLVSNAIRYNRPGGSVCVEVGMQARMPYLEVRDTGIGIPKEAQAKVFERFYRVETSRSRASGGTGLGLAIVKHVAMLHEAQIELESELGEGTTVRVRFPG
jgi:two-component system phosphate regulon sensor histidine kinase PhoR